MLESMLGALIGSVIVYFLFHFFSFVIRGFFSERRLSHLQSRIIQLELELMEARRDVSRLDWLDSLENVKLVQDKDAYWGLFIGNQESCVFKPFIRGAIDSSKDFIDV